MENLIPDWPDTGDDLPGIYCTSHEIEFSLKHEDEIVSWIAEVIEKEGQIYHRIDYIFCSDTYLLDMNQEHLEHDFYTDIITFPINDSPLMAEMYISIDRVKENATQLGQTFEKELSRVMVHGILHLMGYDDHEEDDIVVIREKEDQYLSQIAELLTSGK